MSQPPDNPYEAPVEAEAVYKQSPTAEGDATGGVIPYKNPKALIAYYLGIGSMLVFPLGFVSIILGFMGLAARKRNPVIKGSVHAWIGIVLGALSVFCWGSLLATALTGFIGSAQ